MMKECTRCKETKPLSEFRKNKNTSDGHQYYCKVCACHKISESYSSYKSQIDTRTASRMHKRRNFLNQLKSAGCCKCGENEPICLDFHHTDPTTKLFTISSAYHRNIDILTKEIEKCVILCRNCHAKFHVGIISI